MRYSVKLTSIRRHVFDDLNDKNRKASMPVNRFFRDASTNGTPAQNNNQDSSLWAAAMIKFLPAEQLQAWVEKIWGLTMKTNASNPYMEIITVPLHINSKEFIKAFTKDSLERTIEVEFFIENSEHNGADLSDLYEPFISNFYEFIEVCCPHLKILEKFQFNIHFKDEFLMHYVQREGLNQSREGDTLFFELLAQFLSKLPSPEHLKKLNLSLLDVPVNSNEYSHSVTFAQESFIKAILGDPSDSRVPWFNNLTHLKLHCNYFTPYLANQISIFVRRNIKLTYVDIDFQGCPADYQMLNTMLCNEHLIALKVTLGQPTIKKHSFYLENFTETKNAIVDKRLASPEAHLVAIGEKIKGHSALRTLDLHLCLDFPEKKVLIDTRFFLDSVVTLILSNKNIQELNITPLFLTRSSKVITRLQEHLRHQLSERHVSIAAVPSKSHNSSSSSNTNRASGSGQTTEHRQTTAAKSDTTPTSNDDSAAAGGAALAGLFIFAILAMAAHKRPAEDTESSTNTPPEKKPKIH